MANGWDQINAALTAGSPTPTSAGSKVFVDVATDEQSQDYPYIIVHSYSTERKRGLDGTLLYIKETFHLECWGETRAMAKQLGDEVDDALAAARLYTDPNGPDGFDPTMDVRCSDVFVPTWITPEVLSVESTDS